MVLITLIALSCLGGEAASPSPEQGPAAQQAPTSSGNSQSGTEQQRSTLEVQPGAPVIKEKDIYEASGYFHPFVRMPKYVLRDQKAIWTSPFHTSRGDAKWWAIFGTATAAAIATDRWTAKQLPNSRTQVSISTWGSRFGAAYSLIPLSAGFYLLGTNRRDERFRETGLIGFETLIDSTVAVEAIKLMADRARPLQRDGKGHFEDNPNGRWNSGFPSGHAIETWSLASVIAHQYPHPVIIPILAYGLASTVVVSRIGARQHFPGDVVAGSALGWFIGDYVYGKRHNGRLDEKSAVARRILDHVSIGFNIQ